MRRQTYPKRGADKRSLFAVVMMVHLLNYWNVVEDKPVQYVLNERPQHQKAKEDTDPFGCGERPGVRYTCDNERCDQHGINKQLAIVSDLCQTHFNFAQIFRRSV